MANREDVSWVALRDESGSGVLFAVLGLGGASCGPIPIERDIVKAGAAHHFGFVIRPLGAKADAAELARVSLNGTAPVLVKAVE